MILVYSINKVPIRVSQERWTHIESRHPEIAGEKERVVETLSDPEIVLEGDFGELLAGRLYSPTKLGKKYLVVAYKEIEKSDGFVLTAYFTSKLNKRRKVLWKH